MCGKGAGVRRGSIGMAKEKLGFGMGPLLFGVLAMVFKIRKMLHDKMANVAAEKKLRGSEGENEIVHSARSVILNHGTIP